MIDRYTRPEMGRIWNENTKYQKWLEVELAASEALAELGEVPAEAAAKLRKHAKVDAARVQDIEKEVRHDVIAFTTAVAERMAAAGEAEASRWFHYGLTSNDVVDTAQALQIKAASDLIHGGMETLANVLKRRAFEFQHTVQIGRTHGIHAEPITFGLKLALWYDEIRRNLRRFESRRRGHPGWQNVGRGRDLRAHRTKSGRTNLRQTGFEAGANCIPGDFAGSACGLYRHSRSDHSDLGQNSARNQALTTNRGTRSRRAVRRRTERLLSHAT